MNNQFPFIYISTTLQLHVNGSLIDVVLPHNDWKLIDYGILPIKKSGEQNNTIFANPIDSKSLHSQKEYNNDLQF